MTEYIPKRIHQMWLDKQKDDGPVPDKYMKNEKFCESFKKLNPDYEYKVWNMAQVKYLFETHPSLSQWRDFFLNGIKFHIEKCDFARMAVVYIYGGVYADLDFSCHKSLDKLIEGRSFLWTHDILNHTTFSKTVKSALFSENKTSVFNGFFAASPYHHVLFEWMNYIRDNYPNKDNYKTLNVTLTTGPGALGLFAQKNGYTHAERPELYVDNRYILPYSSIGRRRASDIEPYVSTIWSEGTSWGGDRQPPPTPLYIALIILLIVLVLGFAVGYLFF